MKTMSILILLMMLSGCHSHVCPNECYEKNSLHLEKKPPTCFVQTRGNQYHPRAFYTCNGSIPCQPESFSLNKIHQSIHSNFKE